MLLVDAGAERLDACFKTNKVLIRKCSVLLIGV